MTHWRAISAAVAITTLLITTPTQAQSPSTTDQIIDQIKTTTGQVKTWTLKQWDAAKAEYSKNEVKWADCRKQSEEMKLTGKANWSFLYDCMTT